MDEHKFLYYPSTLILLFVLFLADLSTVSAQDDLPDLAIQPVRKTHSEIIETNPHTWDIDIDSDTPIVNESIHIEVLEGVSRNPILRSSNSIDFSSLASIVRDVTSPEMTDEQKALELWRFTMNNCYDGRWGTSGDGLEHLNVYGYGFCGTFVTALEPLLWEAGLPARQVNIGNHAVTEVFYDNDWHYLDAHLRYAFLERDNRSIASLDDLNSDPELWSMTRHKKVSGKGGKKYYYMTMHPRGHGKSPIYSNNYDLMKNDALTLTWQKIGKWCLARGAEGDGKPAPEPPIYANGVFRFRRDFQKISTCQQGLVSQKNIDWDDSGTGYIHPKHTREGAYLIYQVKIPYFIPEAAVAGEFLRKNQQDRVGFDISTDNGKTWFPLWKAAQIGVVQGKVSTSKTQEVTARSPWKYSYLIRINLQADKSPLDVGIYLLESTNYLVYNPKSLPALKSGNNKITFRDESDSSCKVKVTYTWREDAPIQISNDFPLEGEKVTLSALVANIGQGTASKIPVVFYIGDPHQDGVEIGRKTIGRLRPGETASVKLEWKASRRSPPPGKSWQTRGAFIYVLANPDHSIQDSDYSNNTYSRIIKVLHPPDVRIPTNSFIRFQNKQSNPDVISISATIRNFSRSKNYGFYLTDLADATGVVVKFFDGSPADNNQIGSDLTIDRLRPLEFENVSVDWQISKLKGKHQIYAQVFPGSNLTKALGRRRPKETSVAIDIDAYLSSLKK